MEYPFSAKEKGTGFWVSPRAQMENMAPFDCGPRSSISDDPFNFSELMNFDAHAGWCNSPPVTDQIFTSSGLSLYQSMPYASFDTLNAVGSNSAVLDGAATSNAMGSSYNCGDKMVFQQTNPESCYPLDPNDIDASASKQSNDGYQENTASDMSKSSVSRPISWSLDEKMLRALSVFKESSGVGILAQVWVPIKHGDQYILSTSDQPFLLDQMLAGYREVSRSFTFSTEEKPGYFLGLPGRVFISKAPEWTSNVAYYKEAEYLRVTHAVNHAVRGSLALPIFESPEMPCCAVLELVTMKEKPNFDSEMEKVCNALEVSFYCLSFNGEKSSFFFNCCVAFKRIMVAGLGHHCSSICIPCFFSSGKKNYNIMEKYMVCSGKSHPMHRFKIGPNRNIEISIRVFFLL